MSPHLLAVLLFILSPEPLTNELPTPPAHVEEAWETHHPDFIPQALRPKPKPAQPQEAAKPRGGGGMGSGVEPWRDLVSQYFEPGDVDAALCVMRGESNGNPGADNPRSSAAGLWQFLRSTWNEMVPREVTGGSYDSGAVYDPVASTRAAAWLWYNVGPSQWNAYRRC